MISDATLCVVYRDAPEPTGDEGEDADMEMPHVYEAIPSFDALSERLKMFLSQYNEMVRGSGMDLVFFKDAMAHLIRVSSWWTSYGGFQGGPLMVDLIKLADGGHHTVSLKWTSYGELTRRTSCCVLIVLHCHIGLVYINKVKETIISY